MTVSAGWMLLHSSEEGLSAECVGGGGARGNPREEVTNIALLLSLRTVTGFIGSEG